MNAAKFLEIYDRVKDAPDAVGRMRRFVLDLAVRGKLVEQYPGDEPAPLLLRKIHTNRQGRIKHGRIRKKHVLSSKVDSVPFLVPDSWIWILLSETGNVVRGNSTNQITKDKLVQNKDGYPYVMTKDVGYGFDQLNYENGMKVSKKASEFQVIRPFTVLICAEGGSAGRKMGITDQDICFGNKLIANEVWPEISPRYLLYVYMSSFFYHEFQSRMTGVISGISISRFLQIPLPLPPLAEQHRIVAKVDELMALCNQIEEARTRRESIREKMTVSCMGRLTDSNGSEEEFRRYAGFVINNIKPLTVNVDQIRQLRQTILGLAVRGKLVEQDPADESASDLLKRIFVEKSRLAKTIKASKQTSTELPADYVPNFSVPNGWEWTSIAKLGFVNPRNKEEDVIEASFVSMSMIHAEYGVAHRHEIRPWGSIKSGYTHFAEGDVGLAKITPCFENGKSTVFRQLTGRIGGGTTELHVLRPLFVLADYVLIFLKCRQFIEAGIPRMTGTAGQKRVPADYFSNAQFPLPPLAEQHRIVAKVDELMALLDQIYENLKKGKDRQVKLLDSVLREMLCQ